MEKISGFLQQTKTVWVGLCPVVGAPLSAGALIPFRCPQVLAEGRRESDGLNQQNHSVRVALTWLCGRGRLIYIHCSLVFIYCFIVEPRTKAVVSVG